VYKADILFTVVFNLTIVHCQKSPADGI